MTVLCFVILLLGISLVTAEEKSKCKLDLGLLVDTTKSIKEENIPKLDAALRHLIQQFDISRDGTHVSLETFSKEATLRNKFSDEQYHNEDATLNLISKSIKDLAQPTRLDKALRLAKDEMYKEESGLRPGVPRAMVLYTDGRSHPDTEDFYLVIVALKMEAVRIIVVGIGPDARKPKNRQVLEYIGGKNLFFVDDYQSLDDATYDIRTLICPPDPCEKSKGMDVALVIDKTKSLGVPNFLLLKGFLLELVDALHIGTNATHTGIITFNKKPKVLSTFANDKLYSNEAVHDFLEKISVVLGDRTFTDKALRAAEKQLFTEEGGDRPDFPNVLIVFTDGRTNPASKPFSEIIPPLKDKKVHIVAVGIGPYEDFEGQLEEIAGKNVHNASNFDELSDLFDEILAETCSVDGGFSRWSLWSECDATCGDGVQSRTRTRTCTHPPPQGYGKDCDGPLKETRSCNERPCPSADEDHVSVQASPSQEEFRETE